jgi:drug/metabolite transporter (DMT)-like permease
MKNSTTAILMAVLAAALYGLSSPFAKLLLDQLPPTLLAALLYLGAGLGMLVVNLILGFRKRKRIEARLSKKEWPYLVGVIILDIAAPVLLMFALTVTTAANTSLLNNFEIVATALTALLLFHEAIGRRMWLAIGLITAACIILSIEEGASFSFSFGSLLVILACICWGFENNFTRMLSLKDPLQIVVIKGLGSGTGSLLIALALKQTSKNIYYLALALLLGLVAYGMSIYFYILAQRTLGAARTSAYYAVAPFFGVLISILVFGQKMTWTFVVALIVMLLGAYFAAIEIHQHAHLHEALTHEHRHNHHDGHHTHLNPGELDTEHSHVHTHEAQAHAHKHTPDMHHHHPH